MRLTSTLIAIGIVFNVAACGSQKSSDAPSAPPQAPAVSPADKQKLDVAFSQIPQAAIVRVPLDSKGQPSGAPEMRTYSGSIALTDPTSADKAFNAGAAPSKMVASKDELDGDSSTQSWSSWTGYGSSYGNNGYGNTGYGNTGYGNTGYGNTGYGNTGYGNTGYGTPGYGYATPVNAYSGYGNIGYGTYGNNYWQTGYQPSLYWQGSQFSYGYASTYNSGGYGYYCYSPYKTW